MMIVTVEGESEGNYGLVVADAGPNPIKVHAAVKLMTGKSTKEVMELLHAARPVVLIGEKRVLLQEAIALEKAGARVEFILVD